MLPLNSIPTLNSKKLKPNTDYKISLTVGKSNCLNVHNYYKLFKSPKCQIFGEGLPGVAFLRINPNLIVANTFNLEIDVNIPGISYDIIAVNLLLNQSYIIAENIVPQDIGTFYLNSVPCNVPPGQYVLALISEIGLSQANFIKL